MTFRDRAEAGRRLAQELRHLRGSDVVVLGLPRGGVPVAAEVARELGAPLDVIVIRKVGVPWQPELAMGAVGESGAGVVNVGVVRRAGVQPEELRAAQAHARVEVQRRLQALRGVRARVPVEGRTALVIDDGIATGATARAACQVARAEGAARVVVAAPVGSPGAVAGLSELADEVVCLEQPAGFTAVGQFYEDFRPTTDNEVTVLLEQPADPPGTDEAVVVPADGVRLAGRLTVPDGATGVVVFAHGSGSSRHSPRNQHVAHALHRAGLGTLLFDLLTAEEELERTNVFDLALLSRRLLDVIAWVRAEKTISDLPIGLFGASTGAAAALWAAAEPGAGIAAVVSRGGRPDLAGPRLTEVAAPTLLIVGGADRLVLSLNRAAATRLRCEHRLAVVPGASHLFEEPDALDSVAGMAAAWFTQHFTAARRATAGRA